MDENNLDTELHNEMFATEGNEYLMFDKLFRGIINKKRERSGIQA